MVCYVLAYAQAYIIGACLLGYTKPGLYQMRHWSSICFIYWTSHYRTRRSHGLLIAKRQTLVCLSNRLLQIAYTARSQVRSYPSIGAENNALARDCVVLLRGCFLHFVDFARLLGKNQVYLLLKLCNFTHWSSSCSVPIVLPGI